MSQPGDSHPQRAQAQKIIDGAKRENATLDNVEGLLVLVEQVSNAPPRDIADFFASHMGACCPWDRHTTLGFSNAGSLISWKDVRSGQQWLTASHVFSAVSMKYLSRLGNALVNHSADYVDGWVKGFIAMREGKSFSLQYGYGSANRLGDYMGDALAAALSVSLDEKLSVAFKAARKAMNL